jgi:serine/threonine-protein kinase
MCSIGDSDRAGDGLVSGTPEYMAPEVILGEHGLIESDVYAVGALLYELVTGTTPFAGGSSFEILCRHLDEDVVSSWLRCPYRTIPNAMDDVMQRALRKLPAERFRSAQDFASTLRAATPRIEPASSAGSPMATRLSNEATTMNWHSEHQD